MALRGHFILQVFLARLLTRKMLRTSRTLFVQTVLLFGWVVLGGFPSGLNSSEGQVEDSETLQGGGCQRLFTVKSLPEKVGDPGTMGA